MNFKMHVWAAAGMIGWSDIAGAQTAASPAGADALEEIIVTAQRRSEDVQRTALSIDVISQ